MEKTMAYLQAEVSLHQLLHGLEQMVDYPIERLDFGQINRIFDVAKKLHARLSAPLLATPKECRVGLPDRRQIQDVSDRHIRRQSGENGDLGTGRGRRSTDTVKYTHLPKTESKLG